MSAPEVVTEVAKPATTYEWLGSLPMAASAGNTVYSWYEGTKNCCRVSQFAIGTVESTVKYAAGTAAPLVKKLDKPIQAVDSFALNQLVKLEEKVPAIKSQPDEVYSYLSESKDALTHRITERSDAVKNHLNKSKQVIGDRLTSSRDAVYSKIHSSSEAIANSRAGVLVGEGKQAISTRLSQGKDYVSSTLASGRDVVYTNAQNGAEALANTRAGAMIGSGVDSTLTATEGWVDYLLPPEKNELELMDEDETATELKEKKVDEVEEEAANGGEEAANGEDEEESKEEEEKEVSEEVAKPGRVERVKVLSRKVRVRMYYRSLRRLGNIQEQCKSTLEQLRATVDLLKLAQQARDGMDKQYKNLTTSIKDLEEHIRQMLSRKEVAGEDAQEAGEEETEELEGEIKWLTPRPKARVQAALDTAKALSEKVYGAFQYMTGAVTYLPHQLKGGATSAYEKAQELYTTLKPVKVPTDLPAGALNRISEILDTQLGYVRQLGQYITSTLQGRKSSSLPEEEKPSEDEGEIGESTAEGEEEDGEDMSADPSTSQPPGSGSDGDTEEK